MQLFLLLFAAHVCGDFLLYSPKMSSAKRRSDFTGRIKAIALHCFYHSLIIILILWIASYGWKMMIQAALFIGTMHFIIDVSRVYIEGRIFDKNDFAILKRKDFFSFLTGNKNADCAPFMKKYLQRWVVTNLIDQGLHIGIILLFIQL